MPLPVYRLRRLLALTVVLFVALVTGMYFYARSRTRNVLKEIPHKLGYDIKQTANGFQFSKSDGKRTLFTVQASKVKEFKVDGRAELHDVNIVLYGRDSSRFDQIYGDDFAYDPSTGNVTAQGTVQIDLVANPGGVNTPDQSAPKELKNPIHLKTRDLVFNRESGNAWTDAPVEFRTPQAAGTAVGVKYSGKTHVLTLASKIHLELNGRNAAVIDAASGLMTNEPRQITLEHPHLQREKGTVQADRAVFYLSPENHVQRVLATGNVNTVTRSDARKPRIHAESSDRNEIHGRSDEAEFLFVDDADEIRTATLSGNVHFDETGPQPMTGDSGRVLLDFASGNQLETVHAVDGAHLAQKAAAASTPGSNASPQDFDLTAPAIDFAVNQGRTLEQASTLGAAKVIISPASSSNATSPTEQTVVTAGKFEATFATADGRSYLKTMHGSPEARIVNSAEGRPDRVSTSDAIDATFAPQGGLQFMVQQGRFTYTDNESIEKRTQAWATSARYTPVDRMMELQGEPRIASGGMLTTANIVRVNRATGEALAEGQVKSTYNDLKEQPNGALLASSSPIHVTARTMTAHKNPGVALYSGNARLWQDANVIEAPSIQFDRDRRFVVAQGTATQPVQTILADYEKKQPRQNWPTAKEKAIPGAASSPIAITAPKLTYADSERRIHYDGGVVAKSTDFTATAHTLDAYLLPRSQSSKSQTAPGQLDRMVAQGDVVIQEPKRRAEGQNLVYTAAEDKFVLTGGSPSIFDAERGKITGVSLTFFRRDDRVLVEGEAGSPVVTTTRVAQ